MPETVKIGDGMTYLGTFSNVKEGYWASNYIEVPFQIDFIDTAKPQKIYLRYVFKSGTKANMGRMYFDHVDKKSGEVVPYYEAITSISTAGGIYSGYFDFAYYDGLNNIVSLQKIRIVLNSATDISKYDVYYSLGEPIPQKELIVSNFISSNYLNASSNDIYNIINGQVGDNTTVNHDFNNKYETFEDYGLSPEQSSPTTGQSILSKFLDFMNGLGDLINKLVTALLEMVEKVVELFIPTSEQLAMMGDSVSQISQGLQSKFQGFTAIGESFTGVFSSPQSMLNMTIPTQQGDVELIPTYLHGVVSTMRSLLSGFSVVMTGIYIYKRIVGSGDVIEP